MHVACLCACVHGTGWFQHPWGTLPMGTAPLKFTIALLTSLGLWSLIYVVQGPSPTPPLPACRRAPPSGAMLLPILLPSPGRALGGRGLPCWSTTSSQALPTRRSCPGNQPGRCDGRFQK